MRKSTSLLTFLCVSITIACAIVCMISVLFAESIFLKDGRIIEGDIVKETDRAMDVKLPDGKKITIPRKDVLRTLVNNSYKTKMYIMKSDKSVLPVYIVEEDNERYVCRKELNSSDEFVVNKDDVLFISKVAPERIIDEKAKEMAKTIPAYNREQEIKWRAPLLRIGFSTMYNVDDELEYLYTEISPGLLLDFFPWRFRNEKGNGIDLIMRLRLQARDGSYNSGDPQRSKVEQLFKTTIYPTDHYTSSFSTQNFCGGLRYSYGMYIWGIFIQPYIFGLYQFTQIKQTLEYNGTENKVNLHGYQLGAGIDIGIVSYIGVFIEASYGYAKGSYPDGTSYNFDGSAIYFGASFRTSYGLIQ